jgi:hypothetical protein
MPSIDPAQLAPPMSDIVVSIIAGFVLAVVTFKPHRHTPAHDTTPPSEAKTDDGS